MGLGQMYVCVSFLNMQMLKSLPAMKTIGWRAEKTTLTTVIYGVKERDVTSDWLWTQPSASASLKEFWCLVHRL